MNTRMSDNIEQDIKRWIEQAVEPKDKALLMILYQMNANLIDNTAITRGTRDEFVSHKSKIDGILNRLRGGWLVLGFSFLIVQSLGIWIINGQLNAIEREQRRNEIQETAITEIRATHAEHTRRLNTLEEQMRAVDKYHGDLNLGARAR